MIEMQPPSDRNVRTAVRVIAEALLTTNPITGPFVYYYRWAYLMPNQSRNVS